MTNIAPETTPMRCANCGSDMNHHADKVISRDPLDEESILEIHTCPKCGQTDTRTGHGETSTAWNKTGEDLD